MKAGKETNQATGKTNDVTEQKDIYSILRANSTVLTNLQRGNIKTQQNTSRLLERTIYELAAQGELSQHDIKNYLDKIKQPDSNGFLTLHWAANYGQILTCKLLLKYGLDVSHKANHGETPLLLAAANGHIHVLKLLLNNGADINEFDEDGNTALIYSSFNNHESCVQELLNRNVDFTAQNVNLDTAYSLAVRNKRTQTKNLIEKHILKNIF